MHENAENKITKFFHLHYSFDLFNHIHVIDESLSTIGHPTPPDIFWFLYFEANVVKRNNTNKHDHSEHLK